MQECTSTQDFETNIVSAPYPIPSPQQLPTQEPGFRAQV